MIWDGGAVVDVFVVHPLNPKQESGHILVGARSETIVVITLVEKYFKILNKQPIRMGVVNPKGFAEMVAPRGFLEHGTEKIPVGLQHVADALSPVHSRTKPCIPNCFMIKILTFTIIIPTVVRHIRHRAEYGWDTIA